MTESNLRKIFFTKRAVYLCSFFCLLFLLFVPARAHWQAVGSVTRISQTKSNGVVLETISRAKISLEFFDLNVHRVRYALNGIFERDFSYAIDYSHDRKTPCVKENKRSG